MAELMVSASTGAMKSLLGKLATLMGEEFARLKNLRKEVKFISEELTCMKDALEGLSYLDELDPQTKRWRDMVREMSYDIEDIVEDFMENIGESNKVFGFVSNTVDRLKTLRARHKIAGQIEDIKKLVIETSDRHQRYKIDVPPYKPDSHLSSNVVIDPRVAMLYENATNLVGVEAPVNEIVNLLADEGKQLKIVSIVGFGGLGKTTLANMVYGRLKGKSNRSAFVSVSQKPDIRKLLHSLLSQLGGTTSHYSELNVLLEQLRECLQNKRYFIVIDDIWDVQAWGIIKCAFPENNLGSRVIVTTRIQDVAKACCSNHHDYILQMKPLNDEASRKLFFGRIFGSEKACPHRLRDISVEILKKCGGLPLAIISISSMLASEGSNQKERWEHVMDSLGSAINLTLERMWQILNLSYKDLPPHLRTCFLYLGMYPEDYKIDRCNLELQWMAESFIKNENGKDVEKVARSCFNELVNRSLIEPVDFDKRGSVTTCKVHDMMLDFIIIKSAEENFFTIVDSPEAITGLDYKIHRLSIRKKKYDFTFFPVNINMSQVRTIMLFGSCPGTLSLSECKFLRVFHIEGNKDVEVLLTGLCKLYHLRYLHMSGYMKCELPLKASVLKHMQTLHLYNRHSFDVFPTQAMRTLLPGGIGNMTSLEDLSGFDFEKNTLENIRGLGELANLRYLLLVFECDPNDMKRRMDALCASLGRLSSLQELVIVGMWQMDGLFPVSPPPSPYRLQTLYVTDCCWFSRIPGWMGELRYLGELRFCVNELLDDDVGILADLPVLSILYIGHNNTLGEMIVFSDKSFPALKLFKLQLHTNSASYLTFQPGAMPKLQKLDLRFYGIQSDNHRAAPVGLEQLQERLLYESNNRSAIQLHPGSPRFAFSP